MDNFLKELENEFFKDFPQTDNYLKKTEKLFNLLEAETSKDGIREILKHASLIKEIADEIRTCALFQRGQEERNQFFKTIESEELSKQILITWNYFIDRLNKAPTRIHLKSVVILIIPQISNLVSKLELKTKGQN